MSDFSKDLKVGDLIGVAYTNKIWLGFHSGGKLGHFWEHWSIKHAHEEFKQGRKKNFRPRLSYINNNANSRIVKLNFDELSPSCTQYKDIVEAREILKELNIIK